MPLDGNGSSTNDADGMLTSVNDQGEAPGCSGSTAHAASGDNACQDGQLRSTTVMVERGGDNDGAEGRANGDQMPLWGGGEEQPPIEQALPPEEEEKPSTQEPPLTPTMPARATDRKKPSARLYTPRSKAKDLAASTTGELAEPVPGALDTFAEISGSADVADPLEPCSPEAKAAGDVATPATQNDPCGWCGSTEVSPLESTQGRIHCKACHAVYNPRNGCWDPGERDKKQKPPVSALVTDCTIEGEIARGPSGAMASSTAGGGAFGDKVTVPQIPPADLMMSGETNPRECREIA